MPRKSKELRLSQAKALSVAWSQSPFADDKVHKFINDMILRFNRGKSLSSGQRRWLDALIEEGVPAIPEGATSATAAVEKAINTFHSVGGNCYDWELNVLRDFRNRVAKGYRMSEKQQALLDRLISDADKISAGDTWSPSSEVLVEVSAAVKLYHGYTNFWKAERPAVSRAVMAVEDFISGNSKVLRQKHAEKVTHAVRGRLKKFTNPRFSSGDIGKSSSLGRVVCMSDVYIDFHGNIVNDWLDPDGRIVTIDQERVSKR